MSVTDTAPPPLPSDRHSHALLLGPGHDSISIMSKGSVCTTLVEGDKTMTSVILLHYGDKASHYMAQLTERRRAPRRRIVTTDP